MFDPVSQDPERNCRNIGGARTYHAYCEENRAEIWSGADAVLTFYLASIELYDVPDMRRLVAVHAVELHKRACEFAESTARADVFVKDEDLLLGNLGR